MSGGGESAHAVDLDLLDATTHDLAVAEEAFGALLHEVSRRVGALHLTWTGEAALAQAAAQAEWEAGFAEVQEALGLMRTAARTAHERYTAAVETNLRMWRSA